MTQMTARMVTSEAQPVLVRRDPATAPAAWAVSIRSPDHLLPSKQKPGGRCRPLMPRMVMLIFAYSCTIDVINATAVKA